jgi:hypothetical protein
MPRLSLSIVALLCLISPLTRAADAGFTFNDKQGEYLDILLDGKLAARYMYGHDTSTPAKRTETYKPYLQVYDAEGKEPITQGAGGKLYPHHRGIYIGWQKLGYDGKKYNFWEMASGDIIHVKFLEQKAVADSASFTSQTRWVPKDSDKAIVEEERTMTVRRAPAPARLLIDFTSKLKAPAGDVLLDGDPEHGGIQYRPHGDISTKDTIYVFPKEDANSHKDTDYPWVGETYTLRGNRISVVEMSHPDNPKGTRWSAYRDYGRFGAFPKADLKTGDTLTVRYRFLIADGEMPAIDLIQKSDDEFAGATAATATPKITVKPAEVSKPAAPKNTPKAAPAK